MARKELLNEVQSDLVRAVLNELADALGKKNRQEAVAEKLGLAQQTVSRAMKASAPVGITIAVALAEAGHIDLAAVLSHPPARWNGQVDTLERAFVKLALERPYAAAAYAGAALRLREAPASFIDVDPRSLTVEDTKKILRAMVGEVPLLETSPEAAPKQLR